MLGHLVTLLQAFVGAPEAPSAACRCSRPPSCGRSKRGIRVSRAPTSTRFEPSPLHELCEAQAARTPDAIAVVRAARSLTYRELDERANRLANHLVELGVGPDVRVAIFMERSIERPSRCSASSRRAARTCPSTRRTRASALAFMVADAGAPVLLTQERLLADRRAGRRAPWSPTPSRGDGDGERGAGRRAGRVPSTSRTSSTPRARRASPRA